jgi:hypothetical protein
MNGESRACLHQLTVPCEYRGHALLQGVPFFTFPRALFEQLVREVGEGRFDRALLDMEYALSDVCGDHTKNIGFWGGKLVECQLLRTLEVSFSNEFLEDYAASLGKSVEEFRLELAVGDGRFQWMVRVRRAYAGWLMSNREFLAEHRDLFERRSDEVARNGVPQMGPVVLNASTIPEKSVAEPGTGDFLTDFERFFMRWRLDSMPAPFVPNPLAVRIPVLDLRPILGHMREAGMSFYFPDIYPVPSRDELRQMIEDALRGGESPEHLAEWIEIVRADTTPRNQLDRFARVFEVQHYLRALYGRHSNGLHRKKSALMRALSEFLRVSEDTIEGDLQFLERRLGKGWHSTAS